MKQIFHQPDLQRIHVLDSRFYTEDQKDFFPGVTTILDETYPKGYGYEEWLKDVGQNAKLIGERAAKRGCKVHQATEDMNNGLELRWVNDKGEKNFELDEWQMILKYAEFWKLTTPILLANEKAYVSMELGYGGTIDRVVEIGGKRYLIDIKTSKALRTTYELQQAAYATMWNQFNPDFPIERTGIIWLNSDTRTEKIDLEKEIYQGKGWKLHLYERHYTDAFLIFLHVFAIWKLENPTYKPLNLIYPDTIKL